MGSYTSTTTINAHYHQLQLESGTSRNTLFQICLGNSSVFIKLSCLCTLPALDAMYIWVQTWTCVRWRGLSIYLHAMKGILANFARSGILVGPEMIISHDTLSRREQAHWDWWDQCKILELFVSALFFWYNNCSTHDSNKRGGAVVWQICVDELTQRSLILAPVGFSETPLNQNCYGGRICQDSNQKGEIQELPSGEWGSKGGLEQHYTVYTQSIHSTILHRAIQRYIHKTIHSIREDLL